MEKKKIAYIGGILLLALIGLSFFSKTIANLSLQKVTVEKGKMSYLNQEEKEEGAAEFEKTYKIFAPGKVKIKTLNVKVGDQIKKGQVLCELDGGKSSDDEQSKALEIEKNELTTTHLKSKLTSLQTQLQSAQGKLGRMEQKAAQKANQRKAKLIAQRKDENTIDLEAAQKKLEADEVLYKEGAVAKSVIEEDQDAIEKLKLKIAEQKENEAEKNEAAEETSQENIESQQASIEAIQNQILETTQEIENNQLEGEKLQLELDQLQNKVSHQGKVFAKEDSVVLALSVEEGQQIEENSEIMQLASLAEGEKVSFVVNEDQTILSKGDEVSVSIPALKENQLKGKITSMKSQEQGLVVEAHFSCPQVIGGEKVEVNIQKRAQEEHLMISYSAINKEKQGYFVYVVEAEEDALGSGYRIKKARVKIGKHNLSSVEILEGISESDCVVISSEQEIQEGLKVKIENEGVFYDETPRP